MKKVIYILGLLLLSTIILSSCTDKDDAKINTEKTNVVKNEGTTTKKIEEKGENSKISKEENIESKKEQNLETEVMKDKKLEGVKVIEEEILKDEKGMTLYIFKKDLENISKCYGDCESKWPVYYNENLKDNGFSSIKRDDGKMQTTFNGQPLYYFFKDLKPGDMNGEGLKDVWYTIKK